jgi:Secretion system C-terminal sorting domain
MNKLHLVWLCLLNILSIASIQAQWFYDDMGTTNSGYILSGLWKNTTSACNPLGVTNQGVVISGTPGATTGTPGLSGGWDGSSTGSTSTAGSICWLGQTPTPPTNVPGTTSVTFTYTITVASGYTVNISSITFGARRNSTGAQALSSFKINNVSKPCVITIGASDVGTTTLGGTGWFGFTATPPSSLSFSNQNVTIEVVFNNVGTGLGMIQRLDEFKIFGSVLAVSLTSFTATPQSNAIKLNWTTASEENSKGFDVERSLTGTDDWKSIGFVKAKGQGSSYEFIDSDPLSISYYRLKEIDFNGKETLSKVVSVNKKNKLAVKVSPNPTSDKVLVAFDDNEGVINVFDVNGRNVFTKKVLSNQTELDINTLPTGIYVVELHAKGDVWREKIVKN